jgi:hypothetical protein
MTGDGAEWRAVCSRCLNPVTLPEVEVRASDQRTVYASDDLAFPAVALVGHATPCSSCATDTLPLAVYVDTARSIAATLRARDDAE